jgi:hypothetical protein
MLLGRAFGTFGERLSYFGCLIYRQSVRDPKITVENRDPRPFFAIQ